MARRRAALLAAILAAAAGALLDASAASDIALDAERFALLSSGHRRHLLLDPDPASGGPAPTGDAAGGAAAPSPAPAEGAGAATAAAGSSAGGSDECDVCTYALENKEMLQPYLCRGLRDPQQQIAVCSTAAILASFIFAAL